MTLSTLVHERGEGRTFVLRKERTLDAAVRRYLVAAVCCAAFSTVYESLSHGVYSPWMVGLGLVPLLLGALPALVCRALGVRVRFRARELWACGVMTLAMGSCLQGVLEIYGTTSTLVWPYPVVGLTLLLAALVTQLLPGATKGL